MTGPLRGTHPAALLLDLDGTLVHSDPLHFAAWQASLSAHGIEIDEAGYARQVSGRHNPDIVAALLPQLGVEGGRDVIDAKEARFRALAEAALRPLPGVRELLASARAAGVATAVVTNAPRRNAEFLLRALGLRAAVDVVTIGDEVAAAKPDPAPYRETLARLGVAARDALAFEDSPSGIASARGAGLEVVGLTTTRSAASLRAEGALLAIADFRDPRLWSGPLAGMRAGG